MRQCRKPVSWEPKMGDVVAMWDERGDSQVTICKLNDTDFPHVWDCYARIPEAFDPKNPDHHNVEWWERRAEVWKRP